MDGAGFVLAHNSVKSILRNKKPTSIAKKRSPIVLSSTFLLSSSEQEIVLKIAWKKKQETASHCFDLEIEIQDGIKEGRN